MAINPDDVATVVESGSIGTIMHIDSDGSDSGTFYDVRLTGAEPGGSFLAGNVVRRARTEMDAPHCGERCEPLPWRRDRSRRMGKSPKSGEADGVG